MNVSYILLIGFQNINQKYALLLSNKDNLIVACIENEPISKV